MIKGFIYLILKFNHFILYNILSIEEIILLYKSYINCKILNLLNIQNIKCINYINMIYDYKNNNNEITILLKNNLLELIKKFFNNFYIIDIFINIKNILFINKDDISLILTDLL